MQTDTIITTILSAAAFLKEPIQAIASQSLRDVYEAANRPTWLSIPLDAIDRLLATSPAGNGAGSPTSESLEDQ